MEGDEMKTNVITLNSSNVHNITIINYSIRYTRQIDRKFYTLELHCESSDEVLSYLSSIGNLDDATFKLSCDLSKSLNVDCEC